MKTSDSPAPPSSPSDATPRSLRWTDADAFYEALLDAHLGLNREQSEALNARLVLTLAHEVGDTEALVRCIALAQAAA